MAKTVSATACAEKGIWTPLPTPPPQHTSLTLAQIDPAQAELVSARGSMSFHMAGCSGDDPSSNTRAVAEAMSAQGDASFLYHLGDITYVAPGTRGNQPKLYKRQFFAPYSDYPRQIVAIAGNHDGKTAPVAKRSALEAFLATFCAPAESWPAPSAGNGPGARPAMIQPYPYWRLDTPLASMIGLYANVSNGGILDDPAAHPEFTSGPQYRWLVAQLDELRTLNAASERRRAVLLAVHYPPYAGATDLLRCSR
jgi:hypothetical protein